MNIHGIFVGTALCLFCVSPGHAMEREGERQLMFEILQSRDAEALQAARTLKAKGFFDRRQGKDPRSDPAKSSSSLMSKAFEEAARRKRRAECVLSVSQSMLDRCMASDMFRQSIPKEVSELRVTLKGTRLFIKGKLDGPLFMNPSFQADLFIHPVKKNVFEVRIRRAETLGIKVTRLSGYVYRLMEKSLMQQIGTFSSVEDRGIQPDGSYAIRFQVRPEALLPGDLPKFGPLLRGGYLSYIEINGGQLLCYLRFSDE